MALSAFDEAIRREGVELGHGARIATDPGHTSAAVEAWRAAARAPQKKRVPRIARQTLRGGGAYAFH